MCGRYASTSRRANLLEQFHVDDDNAAELKGPDYNVAPTKGAPVVIARAPLDGPKDAGPVRHLRLLKRGLLPDHLGRTLRSANPGVLVTRNSNRVNVSTGRTLTGRGCRTAATGTPAEPRTIRTEACPVAERLSDGQATPHRPATDRRIRGFRILHAMTARVCRRRVLR
jgi:hypothetical protein